MRSSCFSDTFMDRAFDLFAYTLHLISFIVFTLIRLSAVTRSRKEGAGSLRAA
jgi:hypothetical protein